MVRHVGSLSHVLFFFFLKKIKNKNYKRRVIYLLNCSHINGDLKIMLGHFRFQKSFSMHSRLKTLKKHHLSVNITIFNSKYL